MPEFVGPNWEGLGTQQHYEAIEEGGVTAACDHGAGRSMALKYILRTIGEWRGLSDFIDDQEPSDPEKDQELPDLGDDQELLDPEEDQELSNPLPRFDNAGLTPVTEGDTLEQLSKTEVAVVNTLGILDTRLHVDAKNEVQTRLTRGMVERRLAAGGLVVLLKSLRTLRKLPVDLRGGIMLHERVLVCPIPDYRFTSVDEVPEIAAESAFNSVGGVAIKLMQHGDKGNDYIF